MLGAIAGDIIGSVYEFENHRSTEFPLFDERCFFTDDTVLTVALAEAIVYRRGYVDLLKEYFRRYPGRGYGLSFAKWPVGFAFGTLDEVLANARKYAEVTHNHPEGIKGAQATAAAIFLARTGSSKQKIKREIETRFGYALSRTCDEIRPAYGFDESCQGTVPEAITAFLESRDWESAVRLAVSLGGDSDTIPCITGGIAEAFYGGVPDGVAERVWGMLDPDLAGVTRASRKSGGGALPGKE